MSHSDLINHSITTTTPEVGSRHAGQAWRAAPVVGRRRVPVPVRVAAAVTLLLTTAACTSDGGAASSSSPAPSVSSSSATSPSSSAPSSSSPATTSGAPTSDPGTSDPAPTTTPVQGTATPIVTYSGYDATSRTLQAAAFVTGVQQDTGGTCTLTVTSPSGVATTADQAATPDASTTQCGTLSAAPATLQPGTWTGTVSYRSATASGSSAPFTVEVSP